MGFGCVRCQLGERTSGIAATPSVDPAESPSVRSPAARVVTPIVTHPTATRDRVRIEGEAAAQIAVGVPLPMGYRQRLPPSTSTVRSAAAPTKLTPTPGTPVDIGNDARFGSSGADPLVSAQQLANPPRH